MILADENVDSRIIEALRRQDLHVKSILEDLPGSSDKKIVELTKDDNSLLLTEDKDFGKWVFSHKERISVILLRYNAKAIQQIIDTLVTLFSTNPDQFKDKFTTITEYKIRQRNL